MLGRKVVQSNKRAARALPPDSNANAAGRKRSGSNEGIPRATGICSCLSAFYDWNKCNFVQ